MDQIDWDNQAPRIPAARVWTVPEGDSKVVLLGEPAGVWTHWMGRRSLPCLGEHCPTSRHRRPAQWYGYYPAVQLVTELHERGYREQLGSKIVLPGSSHFPAEISGKGIVRGLVCTLRKEAGRREFHVKALAVANDPSQLPETFNVRDVLYRLWGVRPPSAGPVPPNPPQPSDYPDEQSYNLAYRVWEVATGRAHDYSIT